MNLIHENIIMNDHSSREQDNHININACIEQSGSLKASFGEVECSFMRFMLKLIIEIIE
jgi:hypothetical protein